MNGKKQPQYDKFILLALLEEPLSLKELEEKTFAFVFHFHGLGYNFHQNLAKAFNFLTRPGNQPKDSKRLEKSRDKPPENPLDVELECRDMMQEGLLKLNDDGKYELTKKGKMEAEKFRKSMEQVSSILENQLNPKAAARNTILFDLLSAIIKLSAGIFSGSVGLIADGADAAMDIASDSMVWIGIKFKKELMGTVIIVLMMFVTASSLGYESITKIIAVMNGTIQPISIPYFIILIEAVALITAGILYFYQRYVGKSYGSLALISQSFDSKNHVYVAAAVIIGVIFSIFGIHFVDALIGAFVAFRIFLYGYGLAREVISTIRGVKTDFSKYEMPFEAQSHLSKLETFKIWILYSIKENNLNTKPELINSLERTFHPEYIPKSYDFRFNHLGQPFDFEEEFDNLIEPLIDKKFLIKKNDQFFLTEKGKDHVDKTFKIMRYHQI